MIEVDLTEFVLYGKFGPFNRDMTRAQTVSILGPDDPGYYPDHVGYGSLVFDCLNRNGPPCAVQIAFPHAVYRRESAGEWIKAWPDKRLSWKLGCFQPGLTIMSLNEWIPELKPIVIEGGRHPGGRLSNACVPGSRVDLIFESESNTEDPTLSCIRGYATGEPTVATEGVN